MPKDCVKWTTSALVEQRPGNYLCCTTNNLDEMQVIKLIQLMIWKMALKSRSVRSVTYPVST